MRSVRRECGRADNLPATVDVPDIVELPTRRIPDEIGEYHHCVVAHEEEARSTATDNVSTIIQRERRTESIARKRSEVSEDSIAVEEGVARVSAGNLT